MVELTNAGVHDGSDYTTHFQQLKNTGIHPAVYWDNFDDSGIQTHYDTALYASGLIDWPMTVGHLGLQSNNYKDWIIAHDSSPDFLVDDLGRHPITGYFTTWDLNQSSFDFSTTGDLGYLSGAHIFYWPDLPYSAGQTRAFRVNLLNTLNPTGSWEFLPSGGSVGFGNNVYTYNELIAAGTALKTQTDAYTLPTMATIVVNYVGNQDSNSPNYQMIDGGGYQGVKAQILFAINNHLSAQVVTCNDYVEQTNVCSFGDGSAVVGGTGHTTWTNAIIVDRSGFRLFLEPYITQLTTGTFPTFSSNQFLICHMLHPSDAVSYSALSSAEKNALDVWLPPGANSHLGGDGPRGYAAERAKAIGSMLVFENSVQTVIRLKSSNLPAHATLSNGIRSSGSIACTSPETIIVVLGERSVSTAGGIKHFFGPNDMGTWHLEVIQDSNSAILKSADSPVPITYQPIPGIWSTMAVAL